MSTLVYGKTPPQARELEEAILGAMMLEKEAKFTVFDLLDLDSFYAPAHQTVYQAMLNLEKKSQAIDILTVVEELKAMERLEEVGGPYFVTKLTNSVVSGAHVEDHCRIVLQKQILRTTATVCVETLTDCYELSSDAFETLDGALEKLDRIADRTGKTKAVGMDNAVVRAFRRREERLQRSDDLTGVPSGIAPLDKLTGGWQDTDLVIIAARPAVGKTAFALNIARNAAASKTKPTPVAFFSLEMNLDQLTDRLTAAESGIPLDLITHPKRMTQQQLDDEFEKGWKPLAQYPIYIDDTAGLNLYELKARARKLKRDHNVGLIIIDYLQLMSGVKEKGANREQEIASISRGLKGLAKELHLPVIALSQLSRDIEKRKDNKKPQLSDLRESGAIEQDADIVMFLSRTAYNQEEEVLEDAMLRDDAEIIIKKHRNGSLEDITMKTVLSIQKWMTEEEYDQYWANLNALRLAPIKRMSLEDEQDLISGPDVNYGKRDEDDDDPF